MYNHVVNQEMCICESKVAPIIGSAIGIGRYWVSVTLSVIGFFLRPLPIMSHRARDVCE